MMRKPFDYFSKAVQYQELMEQAPMDGLGTRNLANQIIRSTQARNIPLQTDDRLMAELMDIDPSYSIPPQLYALMAEIFAILQEVEKNT